MREIERIVSDLIDLRKAKKLSQRQIAKKVGVSYTTIQHIEKRERDLWVQDMGLWLEACGSSMATYFSQHATLQELKAAKHNEEILERVALALQIKKARAGLEGFLAAIFETDSDEQPDRSRQ